MEHGTCAKPSPLQTSRTGYPGAFRRFPPAVHPTAPITGQARPVPLPALRRDTRCQNCSGVGTGHQSPNSFSLSAVSFRYLIASGALKMLLLVGANPNLIVAISFLPFCCNPMCCCFVDSLYYKHLYKYFI